MEKKFTFQRGDRSVTCSASVVWPENCPDEVKQIITNAMALELINNRALKKGLVSSHIHASISNKIRWQMNQKLTAQFSKAKTRKDEKVLSKKGEPIEDKCHR